MLTLLLGSKDMLVKRRCINTLGSISANDEFNIAINALLHRFGQILRSTEWNLKGVAATAIKKIAKTRESFVDIRSVA
jgi:hypothetical protein